MERREGFWRRSVVTAMHGFSCGLPLVATGSTMQAWLTDAKVSREAVGLFNLVGTPYTLKFVWAPVLDRVVPPFLGRRRGWMIVAQGVLGLLLAGIGLVAPQTSPTLFAAVAVAIAFASASQDIVVDAYRRESLPDDELALGSSLYVMGYRIAMLVSGGVALAMADHVPWPTVYAMLGALGAVGAIATLLGTEPELEAPPPRSLTDAVVQPLAEFCRRDGAWAILAFVLLYKLGDNLASSMSMRFYKELGFQNEEIGLVVKTFGMVATIVGGLLGGAVTLRIGTHRALWTLGLAQAMSILTLVALWHAGHSLTWLTVAIGSESVTMGAATSAYGAYMASQTDRRYTATQYALLTALMGVPRTLLSAPTGYIVGALGWPLFFVACTATAIPGMVLLTKVAPWAKAEARG